MKEFIVAMPEDLQKELSRSFAVGVVTGFQPDGTPIHYNTRAYAGAVGGVKVEIFSNEHPPPHFRVKYQGSTANYKISNCSRMNGNGEVLRYEKNIMHWWKQHKADLIAIWDDRRPSDCPVGVYRE